MVLGKKCYMAITRARGQAVLKVQELKSAPSTSSASSPASCAYRVS